MKNKVIRKDYENFEKTHNDAYLLKEYYGVIIKKGKVKIDTKRFLKFFKNYMPEHYDFSRNEVYFTPQKEHYRDYCGSYFIDAIEDSRYQFNQDKETVKIVVEDFIKKKSKEKPLDYNDQFYSGIIDSGELQSANMVEQVLHQERIKAQINEKIYNLTVNMYAQTINNIASHLEHAMATTMLKMGYNGYRFNRRDIFTFMDGRIGNSEKKIKALPHYQDYDKFYAIWNFIKHNSTSTYNKLLNDFPELLYVKGKDEGFDLEFPSSEMAIHYLNLNNEKIEALFEPLLEFYYEFCELCYQEKKYDAMWNYNDFFIDIAQSECDSEAECLNNPLGISPYI